MQNNKKLIFQSEKFPIIQGTIGNKIANFLLDSGSNLTLLDKNQEQEFELETDGIYDRPLLGTSGSLLQQPICNSEIRILNKCINYSILIDLFQIIHAIKDKCGITIQGIIGYPDIKKLNIVLDTVHNEAIIYEI